MIRTETSADSHQTKAMRTEITDPTISLIDQTLRRYLTLFRTSHTQCIHNHAVESVDGDKDRERTQML